MRLNSLYLEAALNKLAEIRERNKELEERRREEILNKLPEYEALELQLMQTMTDAVSSVMNETDDANIILNGAMEKNQNIRRQMDELLERHGYPADYLDHIRTCRICNDKGNTGSEWCECLCRITNEMAAAELNENAPLSKSHFENFDVKRYSDNPDGDNASPFEIMSENLDYCQKYAEKFSGKGSGILMSGGTGLGKTHLSLAIANKVIQKGFCVIYGSVPELIRKIQNEQFNRAEGDTMTLVTSGDLLILDDLGAENNTDWCVSTLYEIINTRQNHQLPLIINTNLTPYELRESYQDRLSSRMFSMKTLFFSGKDNRVALSENFGGI